MVEGKTQLTTAGQSGHTLKNLHNHKPKARCVRWRFPREGRYRVLMSANNSYDEAKRSVEALPAGDQLRLIAELAGRLGGQIERQPRRSLLELRGLGKTVWQNIDVDEYLRRERSSWGG